MERFSGINYIDGCVTGTVLGFTNVDVYKSCQYCNSKMKGYAKNCIKCKKGINDPKADFKFNLLVENEGNTIEFVGFKKVLNVNIENGDNDDTEVELNMTFFGAKASITYISRRNFDGNEDKIVETFETKK